MHLLEGNARENKKLNINTMQKFTISKNSLQVNKVSEAQQK